MYSIRLRGIYATALTALTLEHGWHVVQPSAELQSRVKPEDRFAPFDLEVKDRDDHQGALVLGDASSTAAFRELLLAELPDVICMPAPVELGAIYLGIVHKRRSLGYEIDLGGLTGFLPQIGLAQPLKKGEVIRVQIKEIAHSQPMVTTQLSIAGRFVVLSQEHGVGISKEITDPHERERLLTLGRRFCTNTNGWGIIWRTSAYQRDSRDLQHEVEILRHELLKLDGHPDEGIPGKLCPGQMTLLCEFPGGSKRVLDRWRARLVPTQRGYHQAQVEQGDQRWPSVGQPIFIEHVKVHSELSTLVRGHVIAVGPTRITVRRGIKGVGVYDGLNIPKELGDYAVTEFQQGAWHYETRYYSRNGLLKGIYVNINTPLEIYSDRVRYVDLEIDVVQRPHEPAQIIDESELEHIAQYMSPQLVERARAAATECVQLLNQCAHGAV